MRVKRARVKAPGTYRRAAWCSPLDGQHKFMGVGGTAKPETGEQQALQGAEPTTWVR